MENYPENPCICGQRGKLNFRSAIVIGIKKSLIKRRRLQIGTSQVVRFGFVSIECYNQISQTIPISELTENHTKHLIPTGKSSNMLVAMIFLYDTIKNPTW